MHCACRREALGDARGQRLQAGGAAGEVQRIDLRRLQARIEHRLAGRIDDALQAQPVFGALAGGESLRATFVLALIDGIETAVARARPSPRSALRAGVDWIAVGLNQRFEWRVPLDGPAWPGHYYVLELTRMPITRAVRTAASEAIARMEASLPSLSRAHRAEIVRHAGLSLDQLLARA